MFKKIKLYIKYFKSFFLGKSNFLIKVEDSNFYVRPKSYDIEILGEVYFDKVYLPTLPINFKFNTIVDLGAYIGDFSIWAGKNFSPSKLIMVEPSTDNALLLIENMKINGLWDKSTIVQKAIFSSEKDVGIDEKKINQGKNRLNESAAVKNIKTITFAELVQQNQIQTIDYLKIDIEGSEKFIFTDVNKDLIRSKVRYINLETHKYLGNNPRQNIRYLKELGFKVKYKWVWDNRADMIEAINANF